MTTMPASPIQVVIDSDSDSSESDSDIDSDSDSDSDIDVTTCSGDGADYGDEMYATACKTPATEETVNAIEVCRFAIMETVDKYKTDISSLTRSRNSFNEDITHYEIKGERCDEKRLIYAKKMDSYNAKIARCDRESTKLAEKLTPLLGKRKHFQDKIEILNKKISPYSNFIATMNHTIDDIKKQKTDK